MDDLEFVNLHLLALILRTQIEQLNRLEKPAPTIQVARPPLPIYTPPKKIEWKWLTKKLSSVKNFLQNNADGQFSTTSLNNQIRVERIMIIFSEVSILICEIILHNGSWYKIQSVDLRSQIDRIIYSLYVTMSHFHWHRQPKSIRHANTSLDRKSIGPLIDIRRPILIKLENVRWRC